MTDAAGSTPLDGLRFAALDTPCTTDLAKACAMTQVDKLICVSGKWQFNGTCENDTRCDSEPGPTEGACKPVLTECAAKAPGEMFCQGSERKRCSANLLRAETIDCPADMQCDPKSDALCRCADGFRDVAGVCEKDVCPANACEGGKCSELEGDFSCECGEGFAGTGTKACTDIDECQATTVCSEVYPCINKQPGYSCRGQLAEWPMIDSSNRSYSVDSETATDNVTKLMWQRYIPGPGGYALCNQVRTISGTMGCSYEAALRYCEQLSLAGHSDWRLPTYIELYSLVDFTRSYPAADTAVFPEWGSTSRGPGQKFWATSTPIRQLGRGDGQQQAASVQFDRGTGHDDDTTNDGAMVRCVR